MSAPQDATAVDLCNLYLGDDRPNDQFAKEEIGPFLVCLVDDYSQSVRKVPHHAYKRISSHGVEEVPARPGGWSHRR